MAIIADKPLLRLFLVKPLGIYNELRDLYAVLCQARVNNIAQARRVMRIRDTGVQIERLLFSARTKINKHLKTRTKPLECADEVLAIAASE